jgi:NAD(P)H-dependent FMN reductase
VTFFPDDPDEGSPMILALSGSLKQSSLNSAALRAAASAASREGIRVTLGNFVRELPHFDPDLEAAPPTTVLRFRAACESASGVLLAVPEYAFGIPGSFKNALDWTVGSGSLYRKPVTLLKIAPPGRGERAQRALALVMQALDADVVHASVPVAASDRDGGGEINEPRIVDALRLAVAELASRARAEPGA